MRTEMKLNGRSPKEISVQNMQGQLQSMRRRRTTRLQWDCAGFTSYMHAVYAAAYVRGASHDICVSSGVATIRHAFMMRRKARGVHELLCQW